MEAIHEEARMETIRREFELIYRSLVTDWKNLWTDQIHFEQAATAALVILVICLKAIVIVVLQHMMKKPGRKNIFLPAFLPVFGKDHARYAKYVLVALFIAGIMSYGIALADPQSLFGYEEITAPGKRIALVVDASGSMEADFKADKLKTKGPQRYFTAIAASRYLVELRMKSKQHDLIALVEFGDAAYVITPFTNDHKTVLANLDLVGDPDEWYRFGHGGTFILTALYQGLELFKTYGFLESTGNAIVLVSDGEDNSADVKQDNGKTAKFSEVIADARRNHVPIFFIRTHYDDTSGYTGYSSLHMDDFWKKMCEQTGGEFFVAGNEDHVLAAVERINAKVKNAPIRSKHYTSNKPHYRIFAVIGAACWALCIVLWGCFSVFRTFP